VIEVKEPDFEKKWFRLRRTQALKVLESRKHPKFEGKKQFLDVLTGMYRHAYLKGRNDEKKAQTDSIQTLNKFGDKANG